MISLKKGATSKSSIERLLFKLTETPITCVPIVKRNNHAAAASLFLTLNVDASRDSARRCMSTTSNANATATSSASSVTSLVALPKKKLFSSLALEDDEDDYEYYSDESEQKQNKGSKHCNTCTCSTNNASSASTTAENTLAPCGQILPAFVDEPYPDPLPEPKYTVRRRLMAEEYMTALNSPQGKLQLVESLTQNTAAQYIPLTEHFTNQEDPAYCGVTTLLMVLNALNVDPAVVRWKGGWRYFANETVLLALHPCIDPVKVQRVGITMEQFARLASCQGLKATMKRPQNYQENGIGIQQRNDGEYSVDDFRNDILTSLMEDPSTSDKATILVVSFSRQALNQTGDGHFSPLAAYHAETDSVLVMDVARFKYQPYWVSVQDMYNAMIPPDSATGNSRGWYLLQTDAAPITSEDRRPARSTPLADEMVNPCPVHEIKVQHCPNTTNNHRRHH